MCHVEFECRKGAKFADYFYWLKRNLHQKVRRFGFISLYLFCGTCDWTNLFMSVKKWSPCRSKALHWLETHQWQFYCKVHERSNGYYLSPGVQLSHVSVVFLEIPPYSITEWNRYKRHSNPERFKSADRMLYERISIVNDYIKQINEISNVESPRFNTDLKRARKASGDKHRRYSLCYNEYKDGIHMTLLLSRIWMKRIVLRTIKDCAWVHNIHPLIFTGVLARLDES